MTATDKKECKVLLWENAATPAGGDIATFLRSATSSAYNSGATFAKSDFTFADLDTVYSVVQGCDDAASLPSGVQTARATLILPQIRRAPRHHATGRL